MRIIKRAGILLAFAIECNIGHCQEAFQNLGFESATLVPIPGDAYGRYQIGSALPGWTGYVGGTQVNGVLYNNIFLNSSGIGLSSPGIVGKYSVFLEAGVSLSDQTFADTALAQTGLIPVGTQSLLFKGGAQNDAFGVSLGGQQLALSALVWGQYQCVGRSDYRTQVYRLCKSCKRKS